MSYDLSGKRIIFTNDDNTILGTVVESRVKFGASARIQHKVIVECSCGNSESFTRFVNGTDVIEIID
jgi:hypothetical protein